MAEKTKDLATKEEQEVDAQLVHEACEKITNIFSKHVEGAVKETGDYLVKEFFDGDYEKARNKDKIKNSSKGGTLNQVFDHFKREKSDEETSKRPSKSWLYQAIDLVVQEKDLKDRLDDKTFQTYGKLLLSHKVVLLSVKDVKAKEKLINEAYDKGLSVRDLKDKVSKSVGKRPSGLLTILNNPENFNKEEYVERFTPDALKQEQFGKLEALSEKIKTKKADIEKEIEKLENKVSAYKDYIQEYDKLKANVEEALPFAKEKSRRRNAKNSSAKK